MNWGIASLVVVLVSACTSAETKQQPEPAAPGPIARERASLTAPLTSTAPQPESARALAAASPAAPTPLEVHFIDVGTGDCIWIHTGDDGVPGNGRLEGYDIIIDGGDGGTLGRIDGYEFASAYLSEGNRLPPGSTIEWMILTHPHSDHCGGLPGFLEDYVVLNILDPGYDKETDGKGFDRLRPTTAYGRFYKAAQAEAGERFVWGIPEHLQLDWGAELDPHILWSSTEIVDDDLNNVSIVLRLGFTGAGNDASFLFTGDAEHAVEEHLVETLGDGLRTTVLKAGHHGSNSSTTVSFLEKVQPKHVVISSGNHSFSGTVLPRSDTFQRIELVSDSLNLGTEIWRTDRDDKEPLLKAVGTEGGDDTVVARTHGKASDLTIGYANNEVNPVADPTRCLGMTKAGVQCKNKPKAGQRYCYHHKNQAEPINP